MEWVLDAPEPPGQLQPRQAALQVGGALQPAQHPLCRHHPLPQLRDAVGPRGGGSGDQGWGSGENCHPGRVKRFDGLEARC